MKKINGYQSEDGIIFKTKGECAKYEQLQNELSAIDNFYNEVNTRCGNLIIFVNNMHYRDSNHGALLLQDIKTFTKNFKKIKSELEELYSILVVINDRKDFLERYKSISGVRETDYKLFNGHTNQ